MKAIVIVEKGMVQEVVSDSPLEVKVLDFDAELDIPVTALLTGPYISGKGAETYDFEVSVDPHRVTSLFEEVT